MTHDELIAGRTSGGDPDATHQEDGTGNTIDPVSSVSPAKNELGRQGEVPPLRASDIGSILAANLPEVSDEAIQESVSELKRELGNLQIKLDSATATRLQNLIAKASAFYSGSSSEEVQGQTYMLLDMAQSLVNSCRFRESESELGPRLRNNLKQAIEETYSPLVEETAMLSSGRNMAKRILSQLGHPITQEEEREYHEKLEKKLAVQSERREAQELISKIDSAKKKLGMEGLSFEDRQQRLLEVYPLSSGVEIGVMSQLLEAMSLPSDRATLTARISDCYQRANRITRGEIEKIALDLAIDVPQEELTPESQVSNLPVEVLPVDRNSADTYQRTLDTLAGKYALPEPDQWVATEQFKDAVRARFVGSQIDPDVVSSVLISARISPSRAEETLSQWYHFFLNDDTKAGEPAPYVSRHLHILEELAQTLGIDWREVIKSLPDKIDRGVEPVSSAPEKLAAFSNPYPDGESPNYEAEMAQTFKDILHKARDGQKLGLEEQTFLYAYVVNNDLPERQEVLKTLGQDPFELYTLENIPTISRDIHQIVANFQKRVESGESPEAAVTHLNLEDEQLNVSLQFPLYLAMDIILRWMQTERDIADLKDVAQEFAREGGTK